MRACCVKAFTLSLCDNKGVISEKALGRFQSLHLGDLRTIDGVLSLRFLLSDARRGNRHPSLISMAVLWT